MGGAGAGSGRGSASAASIVGASPTGSGSPTEMIRSGRMGSDNEGPPLRDGNGGGFARAGHSAVPGEVVGEVLASGGGSSAWAEVEGGVSRALAGIGNAAFGG